MAKILTITKKHKKRLIFLTLFLIGAGTVVLLVSFALKRNINLYYTPEQISNNQAPIDKKIRVGGMVSDIQRHEGLTIKFTVTDYKANLLVEYTGILPALFKEGQGTVVLGKLQGENFKAEQILAKHDENYMPKELKKTLGSN